MYKAIFFDRDGVVNAPIVKKGKQRPPWSKEEVLINKNFVNLKNYYSDYFKIFIVTNQPDYKRGLVTKKQLIDVNLEIMQKISPDDYQIEFSDDVRFKKPSPFMLLKLIEKHNIDHKNSWMIGDRWSDIKAGENAGCKTILIINKFSFTKNNDGDFVKINPDYTVKTLNEIYEIIK